MLFEITHTSMPKSLFATIIYSPNKNADKDFNAFLKLLKLQNKCTVISGMLCFCLTTICYKTKLPSPNKLRNAEAFIIRSNVFKFSI
jgi:hypothetical protein